jgi:hypothetical protein
MYKLDYQYVTTAFYLVDRKDKGLCTIKKARMQVENNQEPILFESAGRLLPFYSEQHQKDGAVLVIDIDDANTVSSCDLQIAIMAKESELDQLNTSKLSVIAEQLNNVLNKNAGMIGKYFLPTFSGLRFYFATPLNETQLQSLGETAHTGISASELLVENGKFDIINKINELNLSIIRITPWLTTK